MRAALVANTDDADPGLVGRALRRRGYSFVEYLREDHANWDSLDHIDVVVAMGSSWSTYWTEVADAVRAEQDLLKSAIERGIPVLGICFGAQQLSTVLGGTVSRAPVPEVGWTRIDALPEAGGNAPSALVEGPWMQWHYDRFTVPSGATALADSPAGPQAMVCGRVLGLQFHPEATESIVRFWSSGDGQGELARLGLDQEEILADTRSNLESAARRCDALVEWFLADVAQRHMDQV